MRAAHERAGVAAHDQERLDPDVIDYALPDTIASIINQLRQDDDGGFGSFRRHGTRRTAPSES